MSAVDLLCGEFWAVESDLHDAEKIGMDTQPLLSIRSCLLQTIATMYAEELSKDNASGI